MDGFVARATLDASVDEVRGSPTDDGRIELIVRRPAEGEREVLESAELDTEQGLVGDRWSGTPDTQLTLMNARSARVIAGEPENWPPAGDQIYVDFSLAGADIPPGTRIALGSAVVEITPEPHTGCGKFVRRFGVDAMKWVNSPVGRELNLRGVNARVVTGGTVSVGDRIARAD